MSDLLTMVSELKEQQERNLKQAKQMIESLPEGEQKEFLKKSIAGALSGELNIEEFTNTLQKWEQQ